MDKTIGSQSQNISFQIFFVTDFSKSAIQKGGGFSQVEKTLRSTNHIETVISIQNFQIWKYSV